MSMDNVSDHDVSLLSLLNSRINETSAIPDIPIEDSASSPRISSPLKLSYIPESISESEEEEQINSYSENMTSVRDIINEAINQSTIEGISELKISENPESIIHEEDTFEQSKDRKESLLDPINRLKELMNSQPPYPDNSESLESNTENHSSQESLPLEHLVAYANNDEYYPVSIPFDTDNNFVDISDSSPVSEELSAKFRKRRTVPEALISDDIKQIMSRVQRTNIYVAKLNSLKQETTGLQEWVNMNIGREPPPIIKNYRIGSRKTSFTLASSAINKIYSNPALVKSTSSQPSLSTVSRVVTENSVDNSFTNSMSSNKSGTSRNSLDLAIQASSLRSRPMSPPLSPRTRTSNFLNISNLGRHNSFSKSNRPPLFMPPAVMNDPSTNSPTSPTSSNKISKIATPIKPRQRRLSFQAVTSRFNLGSGSSTPTSASFPTTIEEKNVPTLPHPNSIVVDEAALNKLCDYLPLVDRQVLSKYLCAVGGKDDLMAVDLYMRDLKNGEIS